MAFPTLDAEPLVAIWQKVTAKIGPMLACELRRAWPPEVRLDGVITFRFREGYTAARGYCSRPEQIARIEHALRTTTGVSWVVRIDGNDPVQVEAVSPLNNCFFKTDQVLVHDELRFRSKAEISIYDELTTRRLLFFPNAGAVIGGGQKTEKKEPDFLICWKAKWGILEVMGDHWHTPANAPKDHSRARLFKEFGILCIEFFDADACRKSPKSVVDQFLAVLSNH